MALTLAPFGFVETRARNSPNTWNESVLEGSLSLSPKTVIPARDRCPANRIGEFKEVNSNWSLESELCRLTRKKEISVAIETLLVEKWEAYDLKQVRQWQRGGSETFNYVFAVTRKLDTKVFLIKALVAPTIGINPERQLATWLTRRQALAVQGVKVPTLYAANDGALIEEFIPVDGCEVLNAGMAAAGTFQMLVAKLRAVVAAIDRGGFMPVSLISNLRWDGTDFVWVDFGSDLGPRTGRPNARTVLSSLLEAELSAFKDRSVRGNLNDG